MTYNTIAELLAAKPELEKVREWDALAPGALTIVVDATSGQVEQTNHRFTNKKDIDAAILEVWNLAQRYKRERDDYQERYHHEAKP